MTDSKKEFNYLSPTLDVVFQRLFGEVGCEPITTHFLETIFKEKIYSIDLSKSPILRREYIDDKMGILDVVAQFNNNEWCNIEIQCYNQKQLVERLYITGVNFILSKCNPVNFIMNYIELSLS